MRSRMTTCAAATEKDAGMLYRTHACAITRHVTEDVLMTAHVSIPLTTRRNYTVELL